ncbi:MAG: peptide deformylase [Myxococcales bacterium]
MVREILIWPDPRLKEKAKPVEKVTEETRRLIADMFETMYDAHGVGLAAPQIGVLERILVVDTSPRQDDARPMVFINPVIVKAEGSTTYEEGCLSIPGEAEEMERYAKITVRALDESGEEFTCQAEGLLSIALQHEMDHLDGMLFVDYLSTLKRELIRKRMKKVIAERAEGGTPKKKKREQTARA